MIKHDEVFNANSCLNKAKPDEPIFVLRSTDELAPDIVREWARRYQELKGGVGMTVRQREKWHEAHELADQMEEWRRAHERG